MRPVVVGLLILLLLSAPIDIASAQVPARVETPYTLMDAESRTYLEGGLETPLRGNGPLTGYAYLFSTRPHFLGEDLYLRLVIPPGYLISELVRDHWPSQNSAVGVGVSGGFCCRPWFPSQVGCKSSEATAPHSGRRPASALSCDWFISRSRSLRSEERRYRYCTLEQQTVELALASGKLSEGRGDDNGRGGDPMYKHILIPTDGSPLSEDAVRQGIALARSLGAKATGITVSPFFHTFVLDPGMIIDTPQEYQRECEALAAKYLGVAEATAKAAGVPFRALHVVHDHPYAAIIEAAEKNHCDLIVMASHGRKGVSALILGSETTKVLTHSKVPVLVCR